jgi:hypothetical protein
MTPGISLSPLHEENPRPSHTITKIEVRHAPTEDRNADGGRSLYMVEDY